MSYSYFVISTNDLVNFNWNEKDSEKSTFKKIVCTILFKLFPGDNLELYTCVLEVIINSKSKRVQKYSPVLYIKY